MFVSSTIIKQSLILLISFLIMAPKISDSLITLCLQKKDLIACAYSGKIILGHVRKLEFVVNQYFEIHRCDFAAFFNGLSSICVSIASDIKNKGCLLRNALMYGWTTDNNVVKLFIEFDNIINFSILFTHEEFYNLLQSFKALLFPTLLLNEFENEIFNDLTSFPLEQLIACEKDSHQITKIVKKKCKKTNATVVNLTILIQNSLDIIIIVHKLNNLGANDFLSESLKLVIDSFQGPSHEPEKSKAACSHEKTS